MQDRCIITRLRLLYYTKDMSIIVLSNICTSIGLVNRARYISIDIVLDNDDMFNLWLVNNQANNYNNLFLTRYKYNFV